MTALILLVEDNSQLSECLYQILELNGYEVAITQNRVEALAFLRATPILPDLILADIRIPTLNGYELLEAIQSEERLAAIPLVALSVKTEPGAIQRILDLGATDYVTRPFNSADLLAAIQCHVAPTLRASVSVGRNSSAASGNVGNLL